MQSLSKNSSKFLFLASSFLVISALYLARDVLVPLCLSVLISFVLTPLANWVEKLGLGRLVSVLIVTFFAFSILTGIGFLFTQQLTNLARELPSYTENLKDRIHSLKPARNGVLTGLQETVEQLNQEITAPSLVEPETASDKKNSRKPITTKTNERRLGPTLVPASTSTVESPSSPLDILTSALAPILSPLATAGLVIIFVIFMLVQREDLRDRVIRLIGEGKLVTTTKAIDEAAEKVTRYLTLQVLVNIMYGIPVAIGLYFLGIPNAFLWGLLSALLRFLPYVGAWIAAAMPIMLSLALSPDWTQPICVLGLFIALELLIGNVVEPLILSQSTGLSAITVLISAVFWTWLWGGIGLLLATPLTVCLVAVGKYVADLQFITILFSDQPGLQPHARLYQRILASDQEEALELMYSILEHNSIEHFYQEVMLPAILLVERDRTRSSEHQSDSASVYSSMRDLIDEAEDFYQQQQLAKALAAKELAPAPELGASLGDGPKVLILAANNEGDEIAGTMLAGLLSHSGIRSRVASISSFQNDLKSSLEQKVEFSLAIVSALPPSAIIHTKYCIRKLHAWDENVQIIVGLWTESRPNDLIIQRLPALRKLTVSSTLTSAVENSLKALAQATTEVRPTRLNQKLPKMESQFV